MESLIQLVESRQEWLVRRVIEHGHRTGFTMTVAMPEAVWRSSVAGLVRTLRQCLELADGLALTGLETPKEQEPVWEYGRAQARMHIGSGVAQGEFFGVLKNFRRVFAELVQEADFRPEDEVRYVQAIHRFFDKFELTVLGEWSKASTDERVSALAAGMVKATTEKNRYLNVFESQSSPVVLVGPDGRIANVNQAAGRLLWDLMMPVSSLQSDTRLPPPPKWLEKHLAQDSRGGRGEKVSEEEIETLQGLRQFEVRVRYLADAGEGNLGSVITLLDLTERRVAERTMRQAHDHLRSVLEDFPNPVWISDNLGNCTYVNRSWLRLTGKRQIEGSVFNRMEGVHVADRVRLTQFMERSHLRRQPFEVEYRVLGGDAEPHWLVDVGRPLFDPQGRFTGFVGSCYDITERKVAAEELRRSQAQLLSILESTTDAVLIADSFFRVTYLNERAERFLGVKLADVRDRAVWTALPGLAETPFQACIENTAKDGTPAKAEAFFEALRGWFEVHAYAHPEGVAVFFRDVSARKREEQRRADEAELLRQSEERYALAASATNDGLWDWDMAGGRLYLSHRWLQIRGVQQQTLAKDPEWMFDGVHPDDKQAVRDALKGHLEGELPVFEVEHRLSVEEGCRWVVIRGKVVRDDEGRPVRMVGSLTDITERREAADRLEHQAYHDPLTGLPNRLLFQDRLNHCITRSRRRGRAMFAVLYLDMDRFKLINDTLGHQAGDQFLQDVAARLVGSIRSEDTVARMGGDEFAVLLEEVPDVARVLVVANRIQTALSEPWVNPFVEMATSASIGIALGTTGYQNADEVLRDADIAMYRAKGKGRARHEVFDPEMHDQLISRMELESDLRQSLERGEMRLVYQPVVALATGEVMGFESLLRWANGKRGVVGPDRFVPVAEECGFIVPLGAWALHEACRQAASWKTPVGALPPFVTVNLSARQFSSGELAREIQHVLLRTGLDPRRLRVEITESILLGEGAAVFATLAAIKESGVKIYLDDFGTGYSSLSYLHRYPIDAVKVDKSFIQEMGDPRKASLVKAILDMARSLEMSTIAEGIETLEQAERLKGLGCPTGQGYYFSRPVEAAKVAEILRKKSLP